MFAGENDLNYLAALLVHETAHGFNHFYRTQAGLPSWIDEGTAELVTSRIVGASGNARREADAIAQMRRTHSLGGDFFTRDQIQQWQYGPAFGIVNFLAKYDPGPLAGKPAPRTARGKPVAEPPYRKFINAIKDGAPGR